MSGATVDRAEPCGPDNGGVVFVADDPTTWLVGLLADAVRRKLIEFVRGDAQDRALSEACRAAPTRIASDLWPNDAAAADEVVTVVGEIFRASSRRGCPRTVSQVVP